MSQFNIHIPDDLKPLYKQAAFRSDMSLSKWILRAMRAAYQTQCGEQKGEFVRELPPLPQVTLPPLPSQDIVVAPPEVPKAKGMFWDTPPSQPLTGFNFTAE